MPPREPLPRPRLVTAFWQAAFLAVLPSGGQGAARRNAWAGRSRDAARSRAWREADAALTVTAAPSRRTAVGGG